MTARPLVLCPIDFSNASRGALRHGLAIAQRFNSGLLLLTVDDPILAEAATAKMGAGWIGCNSERELRLFLAETLGVSETPKVAVSVEAVVGQPAVEILRVARERACALIVISTHGRSGPRKYFFGSTAERVLTATTVPVLLTPAHDRGAAPIEALIRSGSHVLVPVDFSDATDHQVDVARRLAATLKQPMLFVHVIEPLHVLVPAELDLPELTAERLSRAQAALAAIGAATPAGTPWDTVIVVGKPADEIARTARERQIGLMVLGLHGSHLGGPHMGSVTYRVLCLAPVLTLALPPESNPIGFN